MGFPERFNRYYTDPAWKPSRDRVCEPERQRQRREPRHARRRSGRRSQAARPGTQIYFLRGNYQGCFEFTKENSGTYDEPIVLYGERNEDKSLGVAMTCCNSGRQTCFNFEARRLRRGRRLRADRRPLRRARDRRGLCGEPALARHRGDRLQRPRPGPRPVLLRPGRLGRVGAQRRLTARRAGDGHGIYLSNGGDWNIVRFNETYGNVSSDFQINADPASTCKEVGIPFNDPRCDAYAGTGEGGQGASDYFLVDSNYFHHGAGNGSGRTSPACAGASIRNNIFGFYPRHGVSFWQETDNPKLGSSDNKIVHNLFITTGRHGRAVQQQLHPQRVRQQRDPGRAGERRQRDGEPVGAADGGRRHGRRERVPLEPLRLGQDRGAHAERRGDGGGGLLPAWFAKFPAALNHDPNDFRPTAGRPFSGRARSSPVAPTDRNGTARTGQVDLGPIEVP